jgi:hypothetical protein
MISSAMASLKLKYRPFVFVQGMISVKKIKITAAKREVFT